MATAVDQTHMVATVVPRLGEEMVEWVLGEEGVVLVEAAARVLVEGDVALAEAEVEVKEIHKQ